MASLQVPSSEATWGIQNTGINSSSTPRSKTPNKSGLTPVRPGKSSGTKLKSGLTPIRPGVNQGPSKSPFAERPKLKSGLLPIKPSLQNQPQASLDFESSFMGRRKSGLKPLKPMGGATSSLPYQTNNHSSVNSASNSIKFPTTKAAITTSKESAGMQAAGRRKSGLLPMKQPFSGRTNGNQINQPLWKPRNSFAPSSSARIRTNNPKTPATLRAINEDKESPANFRRDFRNLSGLSPLDDTIVLQPKAGSTATTRLQMAKKSLLLGVIPDTADLTKSRIPKRLIHLYDDTTHTNVLKDGSSRVNSMDKSSNGSAEARSVPTRASFDKEEAQLITRIKDIEEDIKKKNLQLEIAKEELRNLQEKKQKLNLNGSENREDKEHESDSPFGNESSPVLAEREDFLTQDKSKKPENMYKAFRQSCSFLKTPQPSAFRKDGLRRIQQSPAMEETPNVSRRVQKQLAALFDD